MEILYYTHGSDICDSVSLVVFFVIHAEWRCRDLWDARGNVSDQGERSHSILEEYEGHNGGSHDDHDVPR